MAIASGPRFQYPTIPQPSTTSPSSAPLLAGFDLEAILKSLGGVVNPTVGNTLGKIGRVAQPILGAGLVGAGLAQKEEPGYATEATQYLRNRLAPQGLAQQFSGQIGALNAEYLPLLAQRRKSILDQAQQRVISGQPSSFSTAMSGPEISRIRGAITNEILPAERAHIADIGQYLLREGGGAAGALLNYAKPDPLGGALATLGMNLLGGRGGPGGAAPGQGANAASGNGGNALQMLSQLASGPGGIGQALSSNPQLVQQLGAALGAQLGFDASMAGGGLSGWTAMTSQGVAIPIEAINAGAASGGAGLASLLGPLAGAGLAYAAPKIGQNQFQSTAIGAAGGALAGSAFGPVGTAIGAVVGGLQGFFRERGEQHAQKDAYRQEDLSSQADAVQEIGTFFERQLANLGVDTSGYRNLITTYVSDIHAGPSGRGGQYELASLGGQSLLQAIQQRNPSVTSLNQVPGLRQEFIDYLTRSTFTAGNSIYSGGPATQTFPEWANIAGLARGGYITRPNTLAVVGEHAPEMALLQPGSMVMPMRMSRN